MITKQELIDSGYEEAQSQHWYNSILIGFDTKSDCRLWLNEDEGAIVYVQNAHDEDICFEFPRPFTDIISFNTFANLYL
jgi:hypothetical protein